MATAVQELGKDGWVFDLASRMAANQASEIGEYEDLMDGLGVAYPPLAGRPGRAASTSGDGSVSTTSTIHHMAGMATS